MRVACGGVAGGRGGKGSRLAGALVDGGRGSCLAGGAEPAGAVALASGPGDATATREGPHGFPGGPRQALTARRQS